MSLPDVYSQRAVMASVPWPQPQLYACRYWTAAGAASATSYRLRRPAIIAPKCCAAGSGPVT